MRWKIGLMWSQSTVTVMCFDELQRQWTMMTLGSKLGVKKAGRVWSLCTAVGHTTGVSRLCTRGKSKFCLNRRVLAIGVRQNKTRLW